MQVGFFAQSALPREELAKVWDLANSARQGYLDRLAFHRAMDIIAIAQQVGAKGTLYFSEDSSSSAPALKPGNVSWRCTCIQ